MPRQYEIKTAFSTAITRDRLGRQVVTTGAFQAQLEVVNHHWTLQRCNQWIRFYQDSFHELVTDGGENKTYALRNMGVVN